MQGKSGTNSAEAEANPNPEPRETLITITINRTVNLSPTLTRTRILRIVPFELTVRLPCARRPEGFASADGESNKGTPPSASTLHTEEGGEWNLDARSKLGAGFKGGDWG